MNWLQNINEMNKYNRKTCHNIFKSWQVLTTLHKSYLSVREIGQTPGNTCTWVKGNNWNLFSWNGETYLLCKEPFRINNTEENICQIYRFG